MQRRKSGLGGPDLCRLLWDSPVRLGAVIADVSETNPRSHRVAENGVLRCRLSPRGHKIDRIRANRFVNNLTWQYVAAVLSSATDAKTYY
jgi:hypothetical protein